MPKNVEIKARIADYEAARALIERVSSSIPEVLVQEDTFFNSPRGRLKLRVYSDNAGELIYYKRSNYRRPSRSSYQIFRLVHPGWTKQWFTEMFGIRGTVKKRRVLYKIGNVRVHLDRVDLLGDFIELEVVLCDGDRLETGMETANFLMKQLDIHSKNLIAGAYLDLIMKQRCRTDGKDKVEGRGRTTKEAEKIASEKWDKKHK